jgi:hypothetical protein
MHAPVEHKPKTHDQISLIRVNNEKELRRYNVDELAKDIHACGAPRMFPLFLVYYRGTIRAYIQLIEQIVVYPAFDPKLMEPRDFMRVVGDLAIECRRLYGNPIFMLCDVAEKLGPEHMASLRLKKAEETAYIYFNPKEDTMSITQREVG